MALMDPLQKQNLESLHVPENTWYVACTPDEIADKPLGRQICGEKSCFTVASRTA